MGLGLYTAADPIEFELCRISSGAHLHLRSDTNSHQVADQVGWWLGVRYDPECLALQNLRKSSARQIRAHTCGRTQAHPCGAKQSSLESRKPRSLRPSFPHGKVAFLLLLSLSADLSEF